MRRHRRRILIGLAALAALAVVLVAWHGVRIWLAWRDIERFEFDLDASRAALPREPATTTTTAPGPDAPPPPPGVAAVFDADDDEVDVLLLVGTDSDKPTATRDRADAIVLFIRPGGGMGPLLTSLPRDLLLPDRCSGDLARLTTLLEGCGDSITGPELLAVTVEDFTGLAVDHFAVLSFDAFTGAIDKLGGVEICLQNPMRFQRKLGTAENPQRPVTLDRGCSLRDGNEALHWVRDRLPEVLRDGEWQAVPGGDLARSRRQQTLLIQLLRRLKRFRSPLELSGLAEEFSDAIALDATLSMPGAVNLVWDLRSVRPETIRRPVLAVESTATADGEFARLPLNTFAEVVAAAYSEP